MKIDLKVFQLFTMDGGGWIRVFGAGFGWKDTRKHGLTFSERNGYKRHFEIGAWSFAWLSTNRRRA